MPKFVHPDSREAMRSLLLKAQGLGQAVMPCGQGTRLQRFLPHATPDVWLSASNLQEMIWLDVEDQTCCVEAGMSLHALQKALAPFHLQLDIVAPGAQLGTLGGLFMSREPSLSEGLCGPTRDHVLGATWMMANGAILKSGARVVKSVAGYDVTRLLLGSRGRLAICLDLTLRLRPLRPDSFWMVLNKRDLEAPAMRTLTWELCIPHPQNPEQLCLYLQHAQRNSIPAQDAEVKSCKMARDNYLRAIEQGKHDSPLPSDSPWLSDIAEACAPGAPHFGERR